MTRGSSTVARTITALRLVVALAILAAPAAADGQPRAKVYRIGYIQTATVEEQEHLTKALEEALQELGYVEGRNAVFERRFAGGKQERLPALAAEEVSQRRRHHENGQCRERK